MIWRIESESGNNWIQLTSQPKLTANPASGVGFTLSRHLYLRAPSDLPNVDPSGDTLGSPIQVLERTLWMISQSKIPRETVTMINIQIQSLFLVSIL